LQWEQLWLNYKKNLDYVDKDFFAVIHQKIEGKLIDSGVRELTKVAEEMFGINTKVKTSIWEEQGDVLQRRCDVISPEEQRIVLQLTDDLSLGEEGYEITIEENQLIINAPSAKGILYGAFHIIRQANQGKPLMDLPRRNIPRNNYRMMNHWDDFGGNIERGYSGKSFFFKDREVLMSERLIDYARLMASIGINQVVLNNVNTREGASELITKKYLPKLRGVADIFEEYGIQLFLSINYAASMDVGGLETADPLDEDVVTWWQKRAKEIYQYLPHFGGFLVKADSEGRPGPFTYGRDHSEGANMIARALKPYGGVVIWRCFVYNCRQDWRDTTTDRARAAYDNFMPLDGMFDDNVILQIKNGPVDFQVREPVSPLFGGLRDTNQILEVQIAQEYTGQQIDLCYLLPMWKEVLDFRTYCQEEEDTVADIVSGRTFGSLKCGMAAVANTGDDPNWTGHDLAAANLYGFGRLAWDTTLSSEDIAREWARQTYHLEGRLEDTLLEMLMGSWNTYENYTSPLGIGWMVNIGHHYGPNVDGYEYDVWGTYHRANHLEIGVDRTSKGTGQTQQYQLPNSALYEEIETCPQELLLFFHRVPYSYRLKSGKTLLQHIYDTHFQGVEEVEEMIRKWESLKEAVDPVVYQRVKERFERQLENSKNWRDVINTYFYRKTMIPDEKGRPIHG